MDSALEWDVDAPQSATAPADGDWFFKSASGVYEGTPPRTLLWIPEAEYVL
jgi:hypothetical protein